MNISNNALNILSVKTFKGIGKAWIVKYLKGIETTNNIVDLLSRDTKEDRQITSREFEVIKVRINDLIKKLEKFADGVVAIGDPDFPSHRGSVKNSEQPILLFYRGDLNLLNKNNKNVAVIGLTNPDADTVLIESEVVSKLVENGATIVSGLALGCDTVAHRQALRSNGKTVAILPGALNEILPAENRDLADEIVRNNGLLITEYYMTAKSRTEASSRYQERDRLQALFSDCVVLSASYAKNDKGNDSGSRLAMEYALNYSIPRAVIYDPMLNEGNQKYDLNRQLIREQDGITVINRGNLESAVKSLLLSHSTPQNKPPRQLDLLG